MATRKLLLAAALLNGIFHGDTQSITGGGCPGQVTAMQDFDVEQYLGTWYEQEKIRNVFEREVDCNAATYSALSNGHLKVVNSGERSGVSISSVGEATIPDPSVPSKLKVSFPNMPIKANYWILDTDYDEIAVVWSCTSVGFAHISFAWVLSREHEPLSPSQRSYVDSVLEANGISKSWFAPTNQTGCTN